MIAFVLLILIGGPLELPPTFKSTTASQNTVNHSSIDQSFVSWWDIYEENDKNRSVDEAINLQIKARDK